MGPIDEHRPADEQLTFDIMAEILQWPEPPILAEGAIVAEDKKLVLAERQVDTLAASEDLPSRWIGKEVGQ